MYAAIGHEVPLWDSQDGFGDTALLEPEMTVERVDGFVLSGGSAFGLDAASGAQAYMREQGRGFRVRDAVVPIIPAAIMFDLLNGGDKSWDRYPPYRELGYEATKTAAVDFTLGSFGAGLLLDVTAARDLFLEAGHNVRRIEKPHHVKEVRYDYDPADHRAQDRRRLVDRAHGFYHAENSGDDAERGQGVGQGLQRVLRLVQFVEVRFHRIVHHLFHRMDFQRAR